MDGQCVSSPVYRVIIGNVNGARQMLPDPDWKAEDQIGAQARTTRDKNNDDYNQGGDRSPREERLRTETQRRNQPRSRRMITMPLKI